MTTAIETVRQRLASFPRIRLTHLPTPLEPMDSLSRELGGVRLHIKRDDQTGLAFGGNKARKLEFIMADVLRKRADTVVTWAGVQSNWCRQTAAAAARLGLRSVLVLLKKPTSAIVSDGNLLIDQVFGAEIRVVEPEGERNFLELGGVEDLVLPVVEEERAAGRQVYLAPVGGSIPEGSMDVPLGAFGYVEAFLELFEQAQELGLPLDTVILATGSAGTQAGLLVGAKLVSPQTRVVGISVAGETTQVSEYVRAIADRVLEELGSSERVAQAEVTVLDEYLGEGYGMMNQGVADAIRMTARQEGVLLDPVYTGKSMWGLIDLVRKGQVGAGESVVFLHTGGTPALFPYREEIVSLIEGEE